MSVIAYKARKIAPFLEKASGERLFAPLPLIDNGYLLIADNKIADIGANLRLPPGCEVVDLGDVLITPPLVNAHAHLSLSWLAGKTRWHDGFVEWLESMVPLVLDILPAGFGQSQRKAVDEAIKALAASGTAHVGDVGGSLPGALSAVAALARENGVGATHFCEWLGFGARGDSPWPARCRAEIAASEALAASAAPCGHALYSTAPEIMQAAHAFCKANGRKFSFHLAESPEETETLASGRGKLAEFYRNGVLPENWRPPGLSPFAWARKLGLLGPETLAVHGCQLEKSELAAFAGSGASLCLCARSNYNLGVGAPPIRAAVAAGANLCLGTDGLVSCPDLDLRNEILYLHKRFDLPLSALLRMATANGAAALGLPATIASLRRGSDAKFAIFGAVRRWGL